MVLRRSQGAVRMLILPASMREKSRMSLMMAMRPFADSRTVEAYSRCSSSSSVASSRSVMPITPFIGVRSSWLMLAMNSVFARLADSAASLAPCSSSHDRCAAAAVRLKASANT